MWKRVNLLLKFLVLFFLVIAVTLMWVVWRQGIAEDGYRFPGTAKVAFDAFGTPTITASDWNELIEAQGFVVASERLFQMDLTRRKASGRLSEIFGIKALGIDTEAQMEGRLDAANRAVDLLPIEERSYCDAYARGVNRFIDQNSWAWGIEYLIVRERPAPWTCADSLLVVLAMSETLTAYGPGELDQWHWRSRLDSSWNEFLYPQNHPWNVPMFGVKPAGGAPVPPPEKYIPMAPLQPKKQASIPVSGDSMAGSNSWVWNGKTGTFLVNDPHLGQSVPGIWYSMRLKVNDKEWVVGAALPGLPGIILGMNQSLAWGFTNTGEDVDDYVSEKISPDKNSYLAEIRDGQEVWEPLQKKTHTIHIKGAPDKTVESAATRRGPILERPGVGTGTFSRQWLALRPEALRLPVVKLNKATSWEELNAAIDGLRVPAQNILMADSHGNIGYRVSGSGIVRKVTGRIVQPGISGEWAGVAPPEERRRDFVPADANNPTFMATANQRIWVDEFGHGWASDDRADRIKEVLASRKDFTANAMLELQMDTQSRFRKLLLNWIADHADEGTAQKSQDILSSWRSWNGSSVADPVAFTQSIDAETELLQVLLGRVRETFLNDLAAELGYSWYSKRAWLVTTLEMKDGMNIFGLTDSEVASHLLRHISEKKSAETFEVNNRWQAQHPFKDRIPMVGRFFAVKEYPQYGFFDLVRAESKSFGPSIRLVLNPKDPGSSLWNQPVGQSGHLRSQHFRDFQRSWFNGEAHRVFPENETWKFGNMH